MAADNWRHARPWTTTLLGHLYFIDRFFCLFLYGDCFNPEQTADSLKKYGGFVPGIGPAECGGYLDRILTRLTVLGAGYLAVVCIIPEF